MAKFKKGDPVVQVVPAPITGTVDGFALCQDTGEIQVRVIWQDGEGVQHERFFNESELSA